MISMKKFRYLVLAAAGYGALAMVISLTDPNPSKTHAANSNVSPVQVVNPTSSPVFTSPVGTTPVSGTLVATQGGSWNVAITGTPSVTLAGTPLVGLDPAHALVQFVAGSPFAAEAVCTITSGVNCQDLTTVVPSGQTLVIDHVSAHLIPNPMIFISAVVSTENGVVPRRFIILFPGVPQLNGNTATSYIVSSQTGIEAAGGTAVGLGCAADAPTTVTCDVTISGHLLAQMQ